MSNNKTDSTSQIFNIIIGFLISSVLWAHVYFQTKNCLELDFQSTINDLKLQQDILQRRHNNLLILINNGQQKTK